MTGLLPKRVIDDVVSCLLVPLLFSLLAQSDPSNIQLITNQNNPTINLKTNQEGIRRERKEETKNKCNLQ
eukprot:6549037-Ditylum_brightwellii.AAC.1